jgi:SHS2 domain-containing protein
MPAQQGGYREIEHTADWELHVWAPDLMGLLEQSARGMYALSGVKLENGNRLERQIELDTNDAENLLVAFLSELLYYGENEGIGFDTYQIELDNYRLHATLQGAKIARLDKEIKAVTYHRMAIRKKGEVMEVNIVFDV